MPVEHRVLEQVDERARAEHANDSAVHERTTQYIYRAHALDKAELVAALSSALNEVSTFADVRGVKLGAIAAAQGFERIGLIDDAVEAFLATEVDKKLYLQMASRVARLFKAILPDSSANLLAPMAVLVSYLAAKIQAATEPPDISAVMSDVEELLNDSIATEGYRIGPVSKPEALINLSEIDFEALQAKFEDRLGLGVGQQVALRRKAELRAKTIRTRRFGRRPRIFWSISPAPKNCWRRRTARPAT